MAKTKSDANWQTIDVAELTDELRAAWDKSKASYRAYQAEKRTFEQAMSDAAGVPEGKKMIFGYNFGKLSVALVDDDAKPVSKAKPTITLAQFMAQQQANGRAV